MYLERPYRLWGQKVLGPDPTFAWYQVCALGQVALMSAPVEKVTHPGMCSEGVAQQRQSPVWLISFVCGLRCLRSQASRKDSMWHVFKEPPCPVAAGGTQSPPARSKHCFCCSFSFQEPVGSAGDESPSRGRGRPPICDWISHAPKN